MKIYEYQGNFFCEVCGERYKQECASEGQKDTGESDDYPQAMVGAGTELYCECGEHCLKPSGGKLGAIIRFPKS